ncbi:2OG-Fe(II) oxygenase [Sphingomonas suaedae]|uniref:2OG-Fe(II) oxygenase n=1 Tax=Sphingomonas suaedae TaxID=2599297 RepID=A0A518RCF5_9SPHN|nr:2OG-Fe(II) oxygenase [Sphingomonas suaedae]QDX25061.1 2OG-Fe(II) oxygenase [Sphingomonas suaedae]
MNAKTFSAFSAPPPHWVVDAAFGAELAARLLKFVLEREPVFADTTIGNTANKFVRKSVRSSRATQDFGDLRAEVEARFRARLPAAISRLGLAPFALKGLSMELAAHGDGDFYHRHIDTFVASGPPRPDRILTGVYYFHATPCGFTGGDLRLHSLRSADDGGSHVDIAPKNDRLLLFPAWAPHEVRPVSCPDRDFGQSRFAINCWYLGKSV